MRPQHQLGRLRLQVRLSCKILDAEPPHVVAQQRQRRDERLVPQAVLFDQVEEFDP
jgi:hypothetical protein